MPLRGSVSRASRNTCVACYKMGSGAALWIVGSKASFNEYGFYSVGQTRVERSLRSEPEQWFKTCSLLVRAAAAAHDFGKGNLFFQNKIRGLTSSQSDPYRHEWLSTLLCRSLRANPEKDWQQAWVDVANSREIQNDPAVESSPAYVCDKPLQSMSDCIDALVLTHHGLGASGRFSGEGALADQVDCLTPHGGGPSSALSSWRGLERRLGSLLGDESLMDPLRLKAMYLYCRPALIAADHMVSGLESDSLFEKTSQETFANSERDSSGISRGLKQTLEDHLSMVCDSSGDLLHRFESLQEQLDCLPKLTCERFFEPVSQDRFQWQESAERAVRTIRSKTTDPVLVFNMAGTGAGKTRGNMRIALAMGNSARVSVALNLRSITIQTAKAYEQMGLSANELSMVIGDSRAKQFLERSVPVDDDGNDTPMTDFEAIGSEGQLPDYLLPMFERKPAQRTVLAAPVLVCTLDYLVQAGQPGDQGHYVRSCLRAMTSDLIVDEIDSLDSKSLVSILRLVQIHAFYGRNIICSSATISHPVAMAIYDAFKSGIELRSKLRQSNESVCCLFVDDALDCETFVGDCSSEGSELFSGALKGRLEKLTQHHLDHAKRYRVARFLDFQLDPAAQAGGSNLLCWMNAVQSCIMDLHRMNGFMVGKTKVSVGLIRVPNIKECQLLVKHLQCTGLPVRVGCYHSKDIFLARMIKEQKLDHLLSRHKGNEALENCEEVRDAVAQGRSDIALVLVATPVEEVGRDHDFDWAVIDASSCTSIIQTAGRVNRHRLFELPLGSYNVAIPRYSIKHCKNLDRARPLAPIYQMPGHEAVLPNYVPKEFRYLRDVAGMLCRGPGHLESDLIVNARIRFSDKFGFTRADNWQIQEQIKPFFGLGLGVFDGNCGFLNRQPYDQTRLRDGSGLMFEGCLEEVDCEPVFFKYDFSSEKMKYAVRARKLRTAMVFVDESSDTGWLTLSQDELFEKHKELRIPHALDYAIQMYSEFDSPPTQYSNLLGFLNQ